MLIKTFSLSNTDSVLTFLCSPLQNNTQKQIKNKNKYQMVCQFDEEGGCGDER